MWGREKRKKFPLSDDIGNFSLQPAIQAVSSINTKYTKDTNPLDRCLTFRIFRVFRVNLHSSAFIRGIPICRYGIFCRFPSGE